MSTWSWKLQQRAVHKEVLSRPETCRLPSFCNFLQDELRIKIPHHRHFLSVKIHVE
jgi:hypothetical protein